MISLHLQCTYNNFYLHIKSAYLKITQIARNSLSYLSHLLSQHWVKLKKKFLRQPNFETPNYFSTIPLEKQYESAVSAYNYARCNKMEGTLHLLKDKLKVFKNIVKDEEERIKTSFLRALEDLNQQMDTMLKELEERKVSEPRFVELATNLFHSFNQFNTQHIKIIAQGMIQNKNKVIQNAKSLVKLINEHQKFYKKEHSTDLYIESLRQRKEALLKKIQKDEEMIHSFVDV